MQQESIPPIEAAIRLAEQYQKHIAEQLKASMTSDLASTLANELQLDSQTWVSLNRSYAPAPILPGEPSPTVGEIYKRFLSDGRNYTPFAHQARAFEAIYRREHSVLISAGTGSGKTEAFLVPIVQRCLEKGVSERGVQAVLVYPMNALAADQLERLGTMLDGTNLRYGIYVGSTPKVEADLTDEQRTARHAQKARLFTRKEIEDELPDILITNHVMLDRMLTGSARTMLERSKRTLRFVVLDELHTFRGTKADHLALLIRRFREIPERSLVMIGASATIGEETERERISEFAKYVMGVSEVEVIRAVTLPLDLPSAHLAREETSPETISRYGYQELETSPLLHRIAERIGKAPASLADLASSEAKAQNIPRTAAIKLVVEVLRRVGRVTRESRRILDLRIHIFLPRTGSEVRRCLRCGRMSWQGVRICPDCGSPAFALSSTDPKTWVCKVIGRTLFAVLERMEEDLNGAFIATIHRLDQTLAGDVRFRFGDMSGEQAQMLSDPEGEWGLRLLGDLTSCPTVRIGGDDDDDKGPLIVHELLAIQPPDNRRVLVFEDNREGVSRIASVFRDRFASSIFNRFVAMHRGDLQAKKLDEALRSLASLVANAAASTRTEEAAELWRELPFWLYRECRNKNALVTLELDGIHQLPEIERDVLEVFLNECAIADFSWQEDPEKAQFVYLMRYHACRQHLVYTKPEDKPTSKRIIGRSLAAGGRTYASLIRRLGADNITKSIALLVSRGWLRSVEVESGKTLYTLEPVKVRLNVQGDFVGIEDPDRLLAEHWFRGDVHSSEVSPTERRETERKLRSGALNYVIATPTLEMGIDIGKLNQIVMLGVPPTPANYAQRAGRAGRDSKDRSALIVCLCSDRSAHDLYFARHPGCMIAGVINPPRFNKSNGAVARKHLHAWLLTNRLASRRDIESDRRKRPWLEAGIILKAEALFGNSGLNVPQYMKLEFDKALGDALAASSGDLRSDFYDSGFFPDYGFHRDEVEIRDPEEKRARTLSMPVDAEEPPRRMREPIAKREPEQAYRKFWPSRTLPAGGKFYLLETAPEADSFTLINDGKTPEIRSYRWMLGRDEGMDVSGEIEKIKLVTTVTIQSKTTFLNFGMAFGYLHDPKCRIALVNQGLQMAGGIVPYSDYSGTFRIGYELARNALVFRSDCATLGGIASPASFLSAAAVAIKKLWGIADDDLRVLSATVDGGEENHTIFCDADGNANLPLDEVATRFSEVVQEVYDTTVSCTCEDGCLQCVRSWYSQSLGGNVTRRSAKMFAGWLLGIERLKTCPPPFPGAPASSGLEPVTLKWNQHARHLIVQTPKRSTEGVSFRPETMDQIYKATSRVLHDLWTSSVPGLALTIEGLAHLRGALLGENRIEDGKDSFQRIQFELLRYPAVQVL